MSETPPETPTTPPPSEAAPAHAFGKGAVVAYTYTDEQTGAEVTQHGIVTHQAEDQLDDGTYLLRSAVAWLPPSSGLIHDDELQAQ